MEDISDDRVKIEENIIILLEDKSFQIQNLCRTCLKDNMEMKYSLFESESDGDLLCSDITQLTGVVLEAQDRGLPGYMCGECRELLSLANSFRVKCQYSDDLLRKVLIGKNKFSLEQILNLDYLKKELVRDDEALEVKKKDRRTEVSLKKIEPNKNIQVKDSINICCKICKKPLASKLALQKHMKKHHSNITSQINLSNSKTKASLCYKVEGTKEDRIFLCPICDYTSKRKQPIVGHIRTHTGEKPYKCKDCGMHFSTSTGLSSHKLTHSNQKKHMCPQCGKLFRKKSKLDVHMLVHTGEKKYQCDKCYKQLKSKATLQAHMLRHDNIKNYSCDTCGATFVTCTELRNHVNTHGDEKKYHCTLCDMKFRAKPTLDNHLLRHSAERKFKCTLCDVKHYTESALKAHMVKHTEEKKYSCLYCKLKFKHSPNLNRHMLKSHEKTVKWAKLVDRRTVK